MKGILYIVFKLYISNPCSLRSPYNRRQFKKSTFIFKIMNYIIFYYYIYILVEYIFVHTMGSRNIVGFKTLFWQFSRSQYWKICYAIRKFLPRLTQCASENFIEIYRMPRLLKNWGTVPYKSSKQTWVSHSYVLAIIGCKWLTLYRHRCRLQQVPQGIDLFLNDKWSHLQLMSGFDLYLTYRIASVQTHHE